MGISLGSRLKDGNFKVSETDDPAVEITLSGSGRIMSNEYNFNMPAYDVTVYAEFEAETEN